MFRTSAYTNYYSKRIIFAALLIYTIGGIECDASQKPIFAPTLRMNDGRAIPVIGLGTSKALADEGTQAVKDAIDIGYRHIDTAYVYGNEREVGNAIQAKIADGTIKREDIFVTTKLWGTFHEPEWVEKQLEASLNNLNLTYVDLYLIHAPIPYPALSKTTNQSAETVANTNLFPKNSDNKSKTIDVDYVDTWRKFEQLLGSGRVKSIGVSNFNSQQISRLIESTTIKPAVNQIECHANLNQLKLIEYSKQRDVLTVCYSPLGRPGANADLKLAISDPTVLDLAAKYEKSPAQIVLRYTYQNGAIIIPKSTKKHRLRENIDIFNFVLNDDDMQQIHKLNTNLRIIKYDSDIDSKYYPFHIEY